MAVSKFTPKYRIRNPVKPCSAEKIKAAFKKLGIAGFLFFLIKGLIWLAVFFGAAKLFD